MGLLRWNRFSKKDPRKFGWNFKSPDSKQFCSFWKRAPRTNKWNSSRPETCLLKRQQLLPSRCYMRELIEKCCPQEFGLYMISANIAKVTKDGYTDLLLPSATHDLTWENAWWQLHVLYILVGWPNYKSTSLENVFSRLYLIHFTELYVWICPMIFIRTPVPWASLDILFHGLYFTWYSIQMEFTWHDMQWIYLSWYSITFTGDYFPWALLLIVFNGLTWDTPPVEFYLRLP